MNSLPCDFGTTSPESLRRLLVLPAAKRLTIDESRGPSSTVGTLPIQQDGKIANRCALQFDTSPFLVFILIAQMPIFSVLVAPNDLMTGNRKTVSLFCLFPPQGFARVSNVHFALRIGKRRQRKVQLNGRTNRRKNGGIHERSILADVSSVPFSLLRNSPLILPREKGRELQRVANSSSALYRRSPQRAAPPVHRLSSLCPAVPSQRECNDGPRREISQWKESPWEQLTYEPMRCGTFHAWKSLFCSMRRVPGSSSSGENALAFETKSSIS